MIKKFYHYLIFIGLLKIIEYTLLETRMFLMKIFKTSFSQWGEDILIDNLLGQKQGFYVDVGAYDPTRFSNTNRFYLRGWRGINIEPDPIRISKFYNLRPKDVNLNVGVANKNGLLVFFKFDPQTLSTFSRVAAKDYQKQGYTIIETFKVKVTKLGQILEKECKSRQIDFFSIDTEGFDLEVLKSNNWKKFKPKVICIEGQGNNPEKLLTKLGYKKIYETRTNSIFRRNNQLI